MKVVDDDFGFGMKKEVFVARAEAVSLKIRNAVMVFGRWFEDKITAPNQAEEERSPESDSAADSPVPVHENPSDLSTGHVNERDAAIDQNLIDAWEKLVGKRPSLYAGREIPAKKLDNAKAAYAPLTSEDTVIGLLDGTVIGSAKVGAVFTARCFYWKCAGTGGRLVYADLDPASIKSKYKLSEPAIMMGEAKVILNAVNAKTLDALAEFIAEAARIVKGQKS
jgi:hypothetical protein